MPGRPSRFSTRPVSLLLVAALAGFGLWLFQPWGNAHSASSGGATDAPLPSSLRVTGQVQVESEDNVITHLVVPVGLRGSDGISLEGASLRAETAMSDTAAAAVPATYTLRWLDGNGDSMIDAGERVDVVVDLPLRTSVHPGNPLTLVFKTADGGGLSVDVTS